MLQTIKKKIILAEKIFGREKTFEVAPVFLIPKEDGSSQYTEYYLEHLISEMEKESSMFDISDMLIPVSLKYDIQNYSSAPKMGFCLPNGVFKTSLEHCISYYNLKYHTNQGIIVIDIKDYKDFLIDSITADNLIRQIKDNKNRFLILITFDEDGLESVRNKFEEKLLTDTIIVSQLSLDDYTEWCCIRLKEFGIYPDKNKKISIRAILEKYKDRLNCNVIEMWVQNILWDYAVSQKNSSNKIILSDIDSTEELLRKITDKSKNKEAVNKLGF